MIPAVALGLVALAQNPYPADVTVPEDWRYYGKPSRYKRSSLYSPQGLEIGFPDYHPTGNVAYVQYEMYGATFFISGVIERTRVHLSIGPDGLVAVSYPSDPTSGNVQTRPFDYWSHPKGARQTAQAILIPLTRLDHRPAPAGDTSALKYMNLPTAENPFSLMQAVQGGAFVRRTPNTLELGAASAALESSMPEKRRWQESAPLLGGKLTLAEDSSGKAWVSFAPKGRKPVVMSSSGSDAASMALATIAALTYSTGG